MVEQGDFGVVVPPGSAEALRTAIIRLYEDQELRTRLGQNGRRAAITSYSRRAAAEAVSHCMEEMVSS